MSNPPAFQPSPVHTRLAALDALRFLAALSVLGFHYFFRGSAGPGLLDVGYPEVAGFALYGYLGVNLFFMISGFVIAWSAEGRDWKLFAALRFARIYPAFILCMTLSFIVMALAGDARFPVSTWQWLANLFIFAPAAGYDFIDGVYWSIVLELIFYGWVTVAVATGLFKSRLFGLLAGWMLISALNEFVLDSGALRLLFVTEFSGWFAAGILIHRLRQAGRYHPAWLALLAGAMLLSFATSFRARGWMLEHYQVALSDAELALAVIALFAIFIGTVVFGGRLRSTPTVLALGGLTYPLYLLHQNIGYITLNCLIPYVDRWAAAALVTAGCLALSYAVFAWFEVPARRWLLRLIHAFPLAASGTSDKSTGNQAQPL